MNDYLLREMWTRENQQFCENTFRLKWKWKRNLNVWRYQLQI